MKVGGRDWAIYILANIFSDCLYWKEISPHAGGYFIHYIGLRLFCYFAVKSTFFSVGMKVIGIVSRDGFGF
jgi:hypothetical protein